jgi:hypothetical protein
MTRTRWVVTVDGEVRYTTETDNRDEAELWADQNLDRSVSYDIIRTTPERSDLGMITSPY